MQINTLWVLSSNWKESTAKATFGLSIQINWHKCISWFIFSWNNFNDNSLFIYKLFYFWNVFKWNHFEKKKLWLSFVKISWLQYFRDLTSNKILPKSNLPFIYLYNIETFCNSLLFQLRMTQLTHSVSNWQPSKCTWDSPLIGSRAIKARCVAQVQQKHGCCRIISQVAVKAVLLQEHQPGGSTSNHDPNTMRKWRKCLIHYANGSLSIATLFDHFKTCLQYAFSAQLYEPDKT